MAGVQGDTQRLARGGYPWGVFVVGVTVVATAGEARSSMEIAYKNVEMGREAVALNGRVATRLFARLARRARVRSLSASVLWTNHGILDPRCRAYAKEHQSS